MDMTSYVERLRDQLLAIGAGAGPDVDSAAQRLVAAVEPAVRLTLMELLGDAAAEISAELPSGDVVVRLAGRGVDFVLDLPAATEEPTGPPVTDEEETEQGGVVRLTVRLPESLKARAEARAADAGQSLNTWLVGTVRDAAADRPGSTGARRGARRLSGWA